MEGWDKLERIISQREKNMEKIIRKRKNGQFLENENIKDVPFSIPSSTKCEWNPACDAHNAFRRERIPKTACKNIDFTVTEKILFEQPNCKIRSNVKYVQTIFEPIGQPTIINNAHEFHSNILKGKILDYAKDKSEDMKQLCLEISKDQEGSRYIQKQLDELKEGRLFNNNEFEKELFWFTENIKENFLDLSQDLFGNYVIQKLFDDIILHPLLIQYLLKNNCEELSFHMYGCRVIQKALETLDNPKIIINELFNNLIALMTDQNGNHVVQKAIESCSTEKFILIYDYEMLNSFSDFINRNILELSTKKYGCRVVQKILETNNFNNNSKIFSSINIYAQVLSTDQYGNYVLQHVIINEDISIARNILHSIVDNAYQFSTHKFASNVIERIIKVGDDQMLMLLLNRFLKCTFDSHHIKPDIFYLSKDKFGNYVVQQLHKMLNYEGKKKMENVLKRYSDDLKSSHYSKHIIFKIL